MTPRHPTIAIPDVGEMDHAWDLLGEWEVRLEWGDRPDPIPGEARFPAWASAELAFEGVGATAHDPPSRILLVRQGIIQRTEAGGGALEWDLDAPSTGWRVHLVLWPGDFHAFVRDRARGEELGRLRGRRGAAYYAKKYP